MIETGLARLLRENLNLIQGRRVGLATHAAAVMPDLTHAIDVLRAASVQLTALYGPEHGLAGAAADGAAVGHATHSRTGLPIYSLYGATKEPAPEMLADVDVLLFDMQDVGVRFYTYLSTLFYVLRGAAKAGKAVIVLDRPNPLGGAHVAGPLVEPGCESFVGIAPIPIRHGMTFGELARYFDAAYHLNADLTVIPMRSWQRDMTFAETGLPWIPTSPAMAHLSAVVLYPGTCLLEGTNLSEGRGTALPFEICGAPWLDGEALAAQINALGLTGARFRPLHFTPTASKHAGQPCSGVQLHITDQACLEPVALGAQLLAACCALHPQNFGILTSSWEGRPPHLDLLTGSPHLRQTLERGDDIADLLAVWETQSAAFAAERQPYLLYE